VKAPRPRRHLFLDDLHPALAEELLMYRLELLVVPMILLASLQSPAQPKKDEPAVLLVIANKDFFYREYADPRAELEKAGFRVVVGAASKGVCRPHANSGEGRDGGAVAADVAIVDADASKFVAVVFAGGWGASMYQPAFPGVYADRTYNGDAKTRRAVNALITKMVADEKYVCGMCHGVSVLAWARVNDASVLKGKSVAAPTLQGPLMMFNGQRQQPPSRWSAEFNGAKVSPANAVGDANTSADDVVEDGKIITGQDDQSARELGRRLAARLKGE